MVRKDRELQVFCQTLLEIQTEELLSNTKKKAWGRRAHSKQFPLNFSITLVCVEQVRNCYCSAKSVNDLCVVQASYWNETYGEIYLRLVFMNNMSKIRRNWLLGLRFGSFTGFIPMEQTRENRTFICFSWGFLLLIFSWLLSAMGLVHRFRLICLNSFFRPGEVLATAMLVA